MLISQIKTQNKRTTMKNYGMERQGKKMMAGPQLEGACGAAERQMLRLFPHTPELIPKLKERLS
jgi:hypothetical protein